MFSDLADAAPLTAPARFASQAKTSGLRRRDRPRDNDTVAAIVGAAVGALHGASALPTAWMDDLSGRTGADGRTPEEGGAGPHGSWPPHSGWH